MEATSLDLDGLVVLTPRLFPDTRGSFFESFNIDTFAKATGQRPTFVQDNQSQSHKGVLRGLHFQVAPHAQGKLVRVLSGSIWDVAVDIRGQSPTLGQWRAVTLSAEDRKQLWIPPGFAHGFVALEADTIVAYKATALWHAPSERTIRWDDPDLAIAWPVSDPILSGKDAQAPLFRDIIQPATSA